MSPIRKPTGIETEKGAATRDALLPDQVSCTNRKSPRRWVAEGRETGLAALAAIKTGSEV
jgi:hypothetical protein